MAFMMILVLKERMLIWWRGSGGALRRGSDGLDVEVDVDAVADQDAASLEHLIPGESEVLAVDRRLGDEADTLVPPRVLAATTVLDVERYLAPDAANRQLTNGAVARTYFDQCARLVGELEDAERMVTSSQNTPHGPLRVTAGPNVVWLGPIIGDYLKRYPDVRVELVTTTRTVDLVEERFDLGIRAGTLADSTLVARSLGRVSWFLVATPAYLKKRGRPRTPDDLQKHDFFFFGAGLDGVGPRLQKDGRTAQLALSPRLTANDMDLLRAVVIAGLGVGALPAFQCVEDLRAKRLLRVLPDWSAPSVPIHAVYPSTRHLSPKVKTFLDHLQARLTPPPWELGPAP
jgi:DNA-binding transcriptional LysR family regulator